MSLFFLKEGTKDCNVDGRLIEGAEMDMSKESERGF